MSAISPDLVEEKLLEDLKLLKENDWKKTCAEAVMLQPLQWGKAAVNFEAPEHPFSSILPKNWGEILGIF
jgi:hypothetical protein